MNWRLANCWALSWAVFLYLAATPASGAKPRKSAIPANAKKIELFEAIDGKKVKITLTVAARSTGALLLVNLTEEPLAVEVPLTMGASPVAPTGANRFYYAGSFGTPAAPQSLAVAVNPQWSAPVEKKGRKSNVRTNKKKAGKEAADEKKDGEKKDGEKKDEAKDEKKKDDAAGGSSLVATVPLPPGGSQTLPLFVLGLNMKKPQAAYGPFAPEDLDKVTQSLESAPAVKKVLEHLVQNKIPADVAQTLAWYYNERPTWDELKVSGFVTPAQVEIAQQFADVVEGKAPPPAEVNTGKKKKR